MKRLTVWRRLCQLAVIGLFCALPWINARGFHSLTGTLFSFEFFGIPFADPASALQSAAGAAIYGSSFSYTIFLGAILALLLAFIMGRVFCGWLCPYGFLSDFFWHMQGRRALKGSSPSLRSFIVKTIIMITAVAFVMLTGIPLLGIISFPGEISLLPMLIWQKADLYIVFCAILLPVVMLFLELILRKRFWCIYFCPQSVLLGFAARARNTHFPGLRIFWDQKKCICGKKSPCRDACSMRVNPRRQGGPERLECQMCGECVKTCGNFGHALQWQFKEGIRQNDNSSDKGGSQ